MEITKQLSEKDANRLNIVHFELEGKKVIIRLISQAKNYNEELFEEKEAELIDLSTEFTLLSTSLVQIYFTDDELRQVTNNYTEKYYTRYSGGTSNPTITIATGEIIDDD